MPFTIEFHFCRAGQCNFPETIHPDLSAEGMPSGLRSLEYLSLPSKSFLE